MPYATLIILAGTTCAIVGIGLVCWVVYQGWTTDDERYDAPLFNEED